MQAALAEHIVQVVKPYLAVLFLHAPVINLGAAVVVFILCAQVTQAYRGCSFECLCVVTQFIDSSDILEHGYSS